MNKNDMDFIYHRNSKDCTCPYCTRKETQQFLKDKKDESIQLEQKKRGRPSGDKRNKKLLSTSREVRVSKECMSQIEMHL